MSVPMPGIEDAFDEHEDLDGLAGGITFQCEGGVATRGLEAKLEMPAFGTFRQPREQGDPACA